MRILLVDDEQDIIEGILDGVDFENIGISSVRTATSARDAKKILQEEKIDILLTDIEMPEESGLELLNWLCGRDSQIVTLFCTGYANFDYAQKAVEMHSFDYYLKPISYEELQEHLAAAVAQVRKIHETTAYMPMGKYWLRSQAENKRAFWLELLHSVTPVTELLRRGMENGLFYSKEERFSLWLVHMMDRELAEVAEWKEYGFRNITEDLFGGDIPPPEAMLPLDKGNWLLVLRGVYQKDAKGFVKPFPDLIRQAEILFDVVINVYFAENMALTELRSAYQHLSWMAAQDILRARKLTNAGIHTLPHCGYSSVLEEEWREWLTTGRTEDLSAAVTNALKERAAQGRLTSDYVKALRTDLQQMVFAGLNQCGVNAYVLFQDRQYEKLQEWSLDSVERFLAYTDCLFRRAEEQIRFAAQADTVIGRVKSYVQEHLDEDVNRTNIAKQFFLNPDYLARLFKKETGMTLGGYLQQQRIAEAKKLLCQPGLSVSGIAQRVGYGNYSYFSQFFREKTGMSPSQFRKKYGR